MITMDEIGGLNRKVNILEYGETVDEYGLTHQGLTDVVGHAVWAKIEPARGRTYYEQYKDKLELITKITIRYREGITEDMMIKHRDKIYQITSVVDPYDNHVKLELMCNLKKLGESDDD